MSYTPENQLLEPSLEKIIEGIDEFNSAAMERIKDSTEWKDEHIDELQELIGEFIRMRRKLSILKEEVR